MNLNESRQIEADLIRSQAQYAERDRIIQLIKSELSWNNQSEGFRGGLEWLLDKLEGRERL